MSTVLPNDAVAHTTIENGLEHRDSKESFGKLWTRIYILI